MSASIGRGAGLRRALRLEYLTVGWNVLEGLITVVAAAAADGSQDAEAIERLERRACRLVGVSLWALAAYVAFEALRALWAREEPRPTLVGVALTALPQL